MHKTKTGICSLATVLLSLTLTAGLGLSNIAMAMGPGGTTELDNANQAYITGDFERGVHYADLHLRKIPNDAATHYLKANCLVKLARLAEASHEYSLVTKLAPNSVISSYSKNALRSIQSMPAEQRKLVSNAANSSGSRSSASAKVPPGTLELIRFQAARAKEHTLQTGDSASKDERLKADSQGKAERERVERLSQSGGARGDHPPVSAAELQAMRERAAANAEYLKQVGEAKAERHERESQEKSAELQRQAEDLERQLTDENYNKHRDIKLNPVGTNLYVRNYAKIPPTVKPLRAQAESLSGSINSKQTSLKMQSSNVSGNASDTFRTNAVGQGTGSVRREVKVKGEVLPK
ncbi:MAG: hypothetical protein IT342_11900 [Candidatus Melainabacteria bacterium]|nr:hypothetical protein [Candidatus Melainabacteria bacterium]